MRYLTTVTFVAAVALVAQEPVRVAFGGRAFGRDPLPGFDEGVLFYYGLPNVLTTNDATTGALLYSAVVKTSRGGIPSITSAALGRDGSVAIGVGYQQERVGHAGALVFLDPSGAQTHFTETGRF